MSIASVSQDYASRYVPPPPPGGQPPADASKTSGAPQSVTPLRTDSDGDHDGSHGGASTGSAAAGSAGGAGQQVNVVA